MDPNVPARSVTAIANYLTDFDGAEELIDRSPAIYEQGNGSLSFDFNINQGVRVKTGLIYWYMLIAVASFGKKSILKQHICATNMGGMCKILVSINGRDILSRIR
ncbi:MAG TPA: hypothetical protein VF338_11805 [Leptolinea sp.]